MKKNLVFVCLAGLLLSPPLHGQTGNAAMTMMQSASKLTIGGYGQIDYNQDLNSLRHENGTLDVHRLVMLFGYKFTDRTQFVTELEFEHVSEVYVEQAFLDHKILPFLSLRAGLMLVPMGLVNLYHEPPAYLGVERPFIDEAIAPTTWREIGAGIAGYFPGASLKYELYLMNGFSGYTDQAVFRGVDGFRKGRQKGAESFMSSPTFAGRVSFYGVPGLTIGYSSYYGKSQSKLFDGLLKSDEEAALIADSSRVGISMNGLDIHYENKGFRTRMQVYHVAVSNSAEYNSFGGSDMGSAMYGYYVELGYNILQGVDTDYRLLPFVRYEKYDTHWRTDGELSRNPTYDRHAVTTGINWYLSEGAVLKADYQFRASADQTTPTHRINFGVGVWF